MEDVPGYDVAELLGFGGTGEVWRAVHRATGETVALKRLRPDAHTGEQVQALVHEAQVLRELDTPYVVRLREVIGTGAATVLVLDHAAGGSLAQLLARRGSLDPGEVVTVAAPLAQALAAAHAVGLVHGDVTPSNVLFTSEGMPLLADLGVARAVGETGRAVDGTVGYLDPAVLRGADPSPASDVWALAALCHHLLAGAPPAAGAFPGAAPGARLPLGLLAPTAPRALVAAVESGLATDADLRPGAAALAVALRRAYPAAPVRLAGSASREPADLPVTRRVRAAAEEVPSDAAAQPPAGRSWRRLQRLQRLRPPRSGPPRRQVLIAVGAGFAMLAAAGAGWVSGRTSADTGTSRLPVVAPAIVTAPPTSGSVPSADWRIVLRDLDVRRAEAYATADPSLLTSVWAPGAPALAADTAAVRALADARRTARGVRHEVLALRVVTVTGRRVVLRVTDRLGAATIQGADGRTVHVVGARASSSYDVVLVRTGAGWRLSRVAPL